MNELHAEELQTPFRKSRRSRLLSLLEEVVLCEDELLNLRRRLCFEMKAPTNVRYCYSCSPFGMESENDEGSTSNEAYFAPWAIKSLS